MSCIGDLWFTEREIMFLNKLISHEVNRAISCSNYPDVLNEIRKKLKKPYDYYCHKLMIKNRDSDIYLKHKRGDTYRDLARENSITPQRVMQICHKQGRKY